jgi:hypothetical protein
MARFYTTTNSLLDYDDKNLSGSEIYERFTDLGDTINEAFESEEKDLNVYGIDLSNVNKIKKECENLVEKHLLDESEVDEFFEIWEIFVDDVDNYKDKEFLNENNVGESWAMEECGIAELNKQLSTTILSNIDWDGVANDLLTDYTSLEFNGSTYYYID